MSRPNSSDIDAALIARLSDPALLAMAIHGIWFDEAPPGSTAFVILSLIDETDAAVFGGRAIEDALYAIEYRELKPPTGAGHAKAAADLIDTLLEDCTLVAAGYQTATVHRERRLRMTEKDEADPAIRWNRRGGHYRVTMSTDLYLTKYLTVIPTQGVH
jgi:hypothetical protein